MSSFRIRYRTIEFDNMDIHIQSLRDNQQFSDPLGEAEALGISSAQWPLFGVIWPAGEVLAHEMEHFDIKGKRILEVGCGMALSSHVLNARHADITATDYHPEVGGFLIDNTRLNHGDKIPYLRTNWQDSNSGLGRFDLIIGADLLYEAQHIQLLSGFIDQHACQQCEVIIVDPGRRQQAAFSKKMIGLGYRHQQYAPNDSSYLDQVFKGKILSFSRS